MKIAPDKLLAYGLETRQVFAVCDQKINKLATSCHWGFFQESTR
jgi:hypothetical protein